MAARRLTTALVLGLFVTCLLAASLVFENSKREAVQQREGEAQRAAAVLGSRLESSLVSVSGVAGLFRASQSVNESEFRTYSRQALREPALGSVSWAMRVTARGRAAFEARRGAPISTPGPRPRAAPRRDEYFPIAFFATKRRTRGAFEGIDLGADRPRALALYRARDTGRAAASPPVSLYGGGTGFLVFEPVYRGARTPSTLAGRRRALRGFATGVFDLSDLGREAEAAVGDDVAIQIFEGRRRLYGPRDVGDREITEYAPVAGRRLKLGVASGAGPSILAPGAILGCGLLLCSLLLLMVDGSARRESNALRLARQRLHRERAERGRRQAEERFRRAFEDSGVGMALVGLAEKDAGRLHDVNEALCDITGYDAGQLKAMRLTSLMHPDDMPEALDRAGPLLAGRSRSYRSEERWVHAEGRDIWVLVNGSLVREEDGSPVHRIVQVQDITERKRFEGQLQHLADHDPLTGMFNRRRFEEELTRELELARRYGSSGAVIVLDLDNFKYVNDSLGHSAGDELIRRVARLLRSRLRASDTLSRLGGDEFAVLLPRASESEARAVAELMVRALREEETLETAPGVHQRATASLGVALFGSEDELTGEELLVEADIAMYDAKEAGRDRACVYDAAGERQLLMARRFTWVERIRGALAEDRFVLHAQPIASLTGREASRHELLLRMVGEDGDLIPPASFLGVAERFDLIQAIDRWVVRHAIELLAARQRSGEKVVFEVNLSGKSVTDPDLLALIGRELEVQAVDPGGLMFEVTETAAIVNVERARHFAETLNAIGCKFALDDFGAGFASFYYLKHLTFDVLKIDGEFIRDLPASETNQLVVRSVVEIARGMGKQTVAEYVGDEETRQLLVEYGVDFAQGFHVGRPVPLDEPAGKAGRRSPSVAPR